jgi:SprT-like family protein
MAARKQAEGTAGQCYLFEDFLPQRLRSLGLDQVDRIVMHSNRTVMLSLHRRVLRIHRGYGFAPDAVLLAIIRFLNPRVPRTLRRAAEREFLGFPVSSYAPTPVRAARTERPRPGDRLTLRRLQEAHRELNLRHFGASLSSIPIRLSGRMSTRLGELVIDSKDNQPKEIGISRRHVARHPWSEVQHTLLHEMVHQWQGETGLPVDHGPTFRSKAREVGVLPAAKRAIRSGLPGLC